MMSLGCFNVYNVVAAALLLVPGILASFCGDECHPPKASECTIIVRDILRYNDTKIVDEIFECILDPVDTDDDIKKFVTILASDDQKVILHDIFKAGRIISGWSTLVFDQDMMISPEGVYVPLSTTEFNIGNGQSQDDKGRGHDDRLRMSPEGDKRFLVVKVIDSDGRQVPQSHQQISDDVFGTFGDQVTLKSQMESCSFGKLTIIPGNNSTHEKSPGVIEVTIDKPLIGNNEGIIMDAMIRATQNLLGHSLPGPYSHVMFALEDCYTGKFASWLYVVSNIRNTQISIGIDHQKISTSRILLSVMQEIVVGVHTHMSMAGCRRTRKKALNKWQCRCMVRY